MTEGAARWAAPSPWSSAFLGHVPEPEDEGRVKRLLDTAHARSGHRGVGSDPARDQRHLLRGDLLDLAERLLAGRRLRGSLLLGDEVIDLLVGVTVREEPAVDEERRQVVVGVDEVGEPAQ